jgi:phosphatidate cytidylyltransferase
MPPLPSTNVAIGVLAAPEAVSGVARTRSNLAVRTLSAVVFGPLVLAAMWFGGWGLIALTLVVIGRGSWEFFYLATQAGRRPLTALGVVLALAIGGWVAWRGATDLEVLLLAATMVVLAVALSRGVQDYVATVAVTLAGIIYLGLLGSAPLLVARTVGPDRGHEAGLLLLAVLSCIWLTDTAAFLCGRRWGRRRLAPTISPGKTVVGLVAGALGGLVPVALLPALPSFTLPSLAGLMVLVSAGGQVGDLAESALKRDLGVKDAPPLIPGHGGALDRFDSYLFAFPLTYLYIRLLGLF